MKVEDQVRIPSGRAIAAVISKEGGKMSGEIITNAMKPMHNRSGGPGGGFAGYDINGVLASPFTVMIPDSKNPYKQMYVAS